MKKDNTQHKKENSVKESTQLSDQSQTQLNQSQHLAFIKNLQNQQTMLLNQQLNPQLNITHSLPYNMFDEEDTFTIEIAFPGLIRDSLTLLQEGQWLRVLGKTQVNENISNETKRTTLVNQLPKGIFDQLIYLPDLVLENSSNALYRDGILKITIEKAHKCHLNKVNVEFS